MTWTDLILRMMLCLLIAGVIGAVIGWLLRSLFGGNETAELEESWRGRFAGKEKELETLRADSRNQLSLVESNLADCHTGVKTHLAAIADQEAKYVGLEAALKAKNSEFDKLSAEALDLKEKLAFADSSSADLHARLSTAEASLSVRHSEVGDLTTKLAAAAALAATLKTGGADTEKLKAENDLLRQRIGNLEVDLAKASEWQAKHTALASERDGLQKQLDDLQSQRKAQTEDWEMKALQVSGTKDHEIQELQKRVSELEPFRTQAKDWEVKYLAVLDEKQQESSALRTRVAELEPLGMQLAAIQAEAQNKDSQLGTLEARLRDLEGTHARAEAVSDLIRIQGIGPVYFGKLSQQSGLRLQSELLERGKTSAGRKEIAVQTGIEEALILRWVNHCDLRRLSGVDEQYAELLEAAGVDSVPELAQRNAENLHAKVVAVNEEKRVSPNTPSADDIRQWVEQAKMLPRVVTH